ncbi:MAG: hypothetical protein ACSLEN_08090 [Candidatus Malihini olakiniferum]
MAILSEQALATLKEKFRRVTEKDLEELHFEVERTNIFPDAIMIFTAETIFFVWLSLIAYGDIGLNCE